MFTRSTKLTNEKSKKPSFLLRRIIVLGVAGGLIALGIKTILKSDIFGSEPQIALKSAVPGIVVDPQAPLSIGKNIGLIASVTNKKNNICKVEATLKQGEKILTLLASEKSGDNSFPSEVPIQADNLPEQGFTEGPAELTVTARDCSLLKRTGQIGQTVSLDLSPPTLALTSSQHYINQGGADLVTYQTSADAAWSGIQIGPYRFKGFKKPGSPAEGGEHFVFFVFSYELPPETPITLIALDGAGNEAKTTIAPARFFPKTFRHRDLTIEDSFITTKVGDIITNTPELKNTGDNLQNFLLVNRDLRKRNKEFLATLAAQSDEIFHWQDAFLPLRNASIEASFADYRSYIYNGQKVDEQVHLGFDMAVVEKHPITTASSGRVAFAGYLGIYGNTVILDHGYGIQTLYGHLSRLDVSAGNMVTKGQNVGLSGATGLAGGDHLHFSMLIQGVETNPIEFWDQHWINDHVYLRLGKNLFDQNAVAKSLP